MLRDLASARSRIARWSEAVFGIAGDLVTGRLRGWRLAVATVTTGLTLVSASVLPLQSLADDPPATPSPTATPEVRRSRATLRAPERPRPARPLAAAKAAPAPAPAPVAPVAAPAVATSERIALLIGINHPRGSSPLEGAVTDARYMHDALRLYGFQESEIIVLTEEAATIGAIRGALASFAARSSPTGTAVFAWAGHSSGTSFATYNGERFQASELASALSRVRSKMFVALPTCYSAAYALPGIVGPGRVVVFSSSDSEYSWELGSAGSYMMIYLVREAMIEGHAPDSVEQAFAYAHDTIAEKYPNRVPSMNDQLPGDLVLGPVSW